MLKCKAIYKLILPKENRNTTSVMYWRERIFNSILLSSVVLGFFILIPSIITCIEDEIYIQIAIDLLAYSLLCYTLVSNRISYKVKTSLFVILLYLLGTSLILTKGAHGSGTIYLIAFSIVASAWLGIKVGAITVLINFTTIISIALLTYNNVIFIEGFKDYTSARWFAICSNVLAANLVVTISIGLLLSGLIRSLTKIKVLQQNLKREKSALFVAKQKAEESDQLKTVFISNISHELKTPLNAILGFSRLILKEKTSNLNQIYKFQTIISDSANMQLCLINDLLDISLIESGQLVINKKKVNLKSLIEEINNTFDPIVIAKINKNVSFVIEDKLHNDSLELMTDAVRLKQVINNLVKNAIKFTPKGKVTLSYYSQSSNKLIFSVEDTGPGIEPDKQKEIFNRFNRLNKHSKIQGTGLGLAISKEIVEKLGGNIWLHSEVGVGSKFSFTIPIK